MAPGEREYEAFFRAHNTFCHQTTCKESWPAHKQYAATPNEQNLDGLRPNCNTTNFLMPKILLGLSIVLMLGSAVLGFLTKQKVDGMKTQVASSEQTISQKTADLNKKTAALKDATDQVASIKAQNEQMTAELQTSKDEETKAKASVTDLTAQLSKLQEDLNNANKNTASNTGTGDVTQQLQDLTQQLADAKTQLQEAQQVRDSLQEKNKEMEASMKELKDYRAHREGQMAAANLEGQVLAYNQAWNFVVLSIGDRQGVTANAELIVKRGGDKIAKVRVSSVNPNTAVADIIPGSVSSGVTVQPGDEVVYQGS